MPPTRPKRATNCSIRTRAARRELSGTGLVLVVDPEGRSYVKASSDIVQQLPLNGLALFPHARLYPDHPCFNSPSRKLDHQLRSAGCERRP